jgi:hypothetical protein
MRRCRTRRGASAGGGEVAGPRAGQQSKTLEQAPAQQQRLDAEDRTANAREGHATDTGKQGRDKL